MKKWISDHPYFSTSAIFLFILAFGWKFLYWQEENFAFLLLLYFIVILGIRMDDISRKLGRDSGGSTEANGGKDTIMGQLNEVRASLSTMNDTLDKLLQEREEKDH